MNGWTILLAVAGFFPLLFRPTLGNFTRRATSQRKIDFPTLFYPGPDRKFVTLAPHEIPVSSIGLGKFKLRGRANENSELVIPNFHPNSLPADSDVRGKSPLHVIDLRPKGQQSPSLFEQDVNFNDQPIEPEGSQFPFVSAPATTSQGGTRFNHRPHSFTLPRSNANKALRPYPVGDIPLRALISRPNGVASEMAKHVQRQPHLLLIDEGREHSVPQPSPSLPRFTPKPFHPISNEEFHGTFEDESEILFTPPPIRRPSPTPPPPPPPPVRSPHGFQDNRNPPLKIHFHNSNNIVHNQQTIPSAQRQRNPEPVLRPPQPLLQGPRHQQTEHRPIHSPAINGNHLNNNIGPDISLNRIPRTKFSCRDWKMSGYYADMETGCQMFHVCYEKRQFTFMCPNGTLFDQRYLVCSWWYGVDCSNSAAYFDVNALFLDDKNKNRF